MVMYSVSICTIRAKFVDYLVFDTRKKATNYLKEHGFAYDSVADTRYASYIPDVWYNSNTKCEATILSYCC
jgi:hypothetical protein